MLTVTSAFAASDMITVYDIPDAIRGTNYANDPALSPLITRASSAIMRYCGCVFAQQTYQEDVPGFGGTTLRLLRSPIASGVFAGLYPSGPITTLTSIVKLDSENSTSSTTVTATEYVLQDPMAGLVFRSQGWQWTAMITTQLDDYIAYGSERPTYRATYTAGFTTPNVGTPALTTEGTLPYDLRQACLEAVTAWYFRTQRDPSVLSRRMGDVAVTYATASDRTLRNGRPTMGLPSESLDLLDRWIRWD